MLQELRSVIARDSHWNQFAVIPFAAMIWFFTNHVPGVSHDSLMYFQSAGYLLEGKGYASNQWGVFQPATHFPPLYPITLAAGKYLTGINFTDLSLIYDIICWTLSTLAIMRICKSLKVHSLFGIFCMIQAPVIYIHFMAWSEPLFMVLSLWGIHFFIRSFHKPSFLLSLLAGLLFGLSAITRYNGLIWPLLLFILGLKYRSQWSPRYSLAALVTSVLPLIIWFGRNFLLYGQLLRRATVVTDYTLQDQFLFKAMEIIGGWLLPGWTHLAVPCGTILIITILVLPVLDWKYRRIGSVEHVIWPIIIILSLILITVTAIAVDKTTFPDQRIMSFLNPVIILMLLSALPSLLSNASWWATTLRFTALLLWFTGPLWISISTISGFYTKGEEFTATSYRANHPEIKVIAERKDTFPVIACGYDDVYLTYLTGKPVGYFNEIYKLTPGTRIYMAFLKPVQQLPFDGITYLDIDSVIPGHLYQLTLK